MHKTGTKVCERHESQCNEILWTDLTAVNPQTQLFLQKLIDGSNTGKIIAADDDLLAGHVFPIYLTHHWNPCKQITMA